VCSSDLAKLYVGYNAAIDTALSEAKTHGVTVYPPSQDIQDSIKSFAENNLANVYKTASEKHGLKNPKDLLGRFDAKMKKWSELFAKVDRKDANAIAAIISSELYDKINAGTYAAN